MQKYISTNAEYLIKSSLSVAWWVKKGQQSPWRHPVLGGPSIQRKIAVRNTVTANELKATAGIN